MKVATSTSGVVASFLIAGQVLAGNLGPTADPSKPASSPLLLDEVLGSVNRAYPRLLAARIEQIRSEADLIEARGAYDTRLSASGEARPTEFYDRYTADLEVEQQSRLWGSRVYGGYRVGRGDFPSYLGGKKTNETGELRAGIEIPLLRGGATDLLRTRLLTSEIGTLLAEPQIELQRLDMMRDASEAYWNWVAKGLNIGVEDRLLSVAVARIDQLTSQVRSGAIPRILLVDNQRLVVDRKIRLRRARQEFQDAGFALALYLRDDAGRMVIPGPSRLPEEFPPEDDLPPEQVRRDIERAMESHPRLKQIGLRREQVEARLALAKNDVLPSATIQIQGSHDLGQSSGGIDSSGSFSASPKDGAEIAALLRVDMPVLQRGARGRAMAQQAELTRLRHENQFAEDLIETEIRRASASVDNAFDQTGLARENLELASQLQRAEERKLSLGTSNLIDVNIREIQATDAARQLILAQAAYFQSIARYDAAAARPTGSPTE